MRLSSIHQGIWPLPSVFRDLVTKDLEQLQIRNTRSDHMFRKGMDCLKKYNDIEVHPANKGGGIVILDSEAHQAEMLRLLSDLYSIKRETQPLGSRKNLKVWWRKALVGIWFPKKKSFS